MPTPPHPASPTSPQTPHAEPQPRQPEGPEASAAAEAGKGLNNLEGQREKAGLRRQAAEQYAASVTPAPDRKGVE